MRGIMNKKWIKKVWKYFTSILRFIIIAGISYYILYPLFVKIMFAFMDRRDLYDVTVRLIPQNLTLDNIIRVFNAMEYPIAFLNSLGLTLVTTVLRVFFCLMVGYGFARYDFPLKKLLFMLAILTLLIPPQTIITSYYLQYRFFDVSSIFKSILGKPLNLINTPWFFILSGITCTGIRNGLYIFMFRQFFKNVPSELEEAAFIDGARHFKTFLWVMLPSAGPVITTAALFSIVWQWNDIFYTTWFLPNFKVLPRTLSSLAMNIIQSENIGGSGTIIHVDPNYTALLNGTGCLLLILPLIILFGFAQRKFVESIERSGIVG